MENFNVNTLSSLGAGSDQLTLLNWKLEQGKNWLLQIVLHFSFSFFVTPVLFRLLQSSRSCLRSTLHLGIMIILEDRPKITGVKMNIKENIYNETTQPHCCVILTTVRGWGSFLNSPHLSENQYWHLTEQFSIKKNFFVSYNQNKYVVQPGKNKWLIITILYI